MRAGRERAEQSWPEGESRAETVLRGRDRGARLFASSTARSLRTGTRTCSRSSVNRTARVHIQMYRASEIKKTARQFGTDHSSNINDL